MKGKYVAVPMIALGLVAVGFTDSAEAAHRARSKVTIHAQGTDFSGKVKSPKPGKCANGRQVLLFLQRGKRGGGNDEYFATDTASWENGAYRWHIQDLHHEGKFYAKVRRNPLCKRDLSPTVLAVETP